MDDKTSFLISKSNDKIKFSIIQSKLLVFFSMLYISIMICNAILTNKWIGIWGNAFVFGGAFVSPLLFIQGDIFAEIFGYKISRYIIWSAFFCQTIFAILVEIMIHAPSPSGWGEQHSYSYVLGSILRIDISGFVAFMISSLINAKLVTRWKFLMNGRFFWFRSTCASAISEGLYSMFAILMIAFGSLDFHTMFRIIYITYSIKLVYSLIFAIPGNLVTSFLKKKFKVDIYESGDNSQAFHTFFGKLRRWKAEA